jgi:hypothetical protein
MQERIMAKRSKRGRRSRLGAARKAMGQYIETGASKASDAVTTFLANFDTAELVGALKKQAQTAGRAAGRKVGLVDAPARRKRGRRGDAASPARKAAAKRRPAARRGGARKGAMKRPARKVARRK